MRGASYQDARSGVYETQDVATRLIEWALRCVSSDLVPTTLTSWPT